MRSGEGTLSIRLTDSPFEDALAVLVTFSEVQVHRSGPVDEEEGEAEDAEGEVEEVEEVEVDDDGGGWETVPFPEGVTSLTCDLKQLENGSVDSLGFGALSAGHYTQIRLVVSSASIHFGSEAAPGPCAPSLEPLLEDPGVPVRVPSGVVKLVRQFTIQEDGTTTILLDFDGDKSIIRTGPPVSAAGGNGNGNGNAGGNGNGKGKPGGDDEEGEGEEEEGEELEEDDEDGPGNSGGARYLLKPVIRIVSVQEEGV
jgi:hypothetical protein